MITVCRSLDAPAIQETVKGILSLCVMSKPKEGGGEREGAVAL